MDGTERVCGKKISQQSGVVACFEGRQYCIDGTWSDCLDGEITYRPDPLSEAYRGQFGGRMKPQAFLPPESAPVECNDPCDPYCYLFDEDPEDISAPGGPSSLPEFPGGPGVEACAHELCNTGSALPASCHSCTTEVCQLEPACCTTAWTSDCIALVYSVCADQRPPLSLCDLGLYADTNISVANRSTSHAVVGAYGDVHISTDGAVAGVYAKGNINYDSLNGATVNAPYGIVADGNISSQNSSSIINSYLEAGGSIFIPAWKVQQHAYAGTTLTGQNGTEVLGDARANEGVNGVNPHSGTCSGPGCYTHNPVELPPQTSGSAIPKLATNCTGTTDFNTSGGTLTVAGPGVYRDVNVINNGRLVLQGEGTYYFRSFQVTDRVEFRRTANNTGAGWDIRVCGNVFLGNGTQFVGSTASGVSPALTLDPTNGVLMDPASVVLYTDTTSTINLGTDVYFTGLLIAPNGPVKKENMNSAPSRAEVLAGTRSAPVNGAIWSKQITLGTDALTLQIPKESCDELGIPGTGGPDVCPIENVTPDVPPALNEPCTSGRDCQMNHRCVGPETGPGCAHSKCMPGEALDATCDPCVARICAADPTCCSDTWSSSCVAKVASVCDAVCNPHSCYVPDLCAAQADPVDATCDSCVADICSVQPSCCTTAWTQSCADMVPTVCGEGQPATPDRLCGYAGHGRGGVVVSGGATVRGGDLGSGANLTVNDQAHFHGNVAAEGNVSKGATSVYHQSLHARGTISGSASVAGTELANAPAGVVPTPPWPAVSFSCSGGRPPGGTDQNLWSATLAPGTYGNVSMAGDWQHLTLQAGDYYVGNFTLTRANTTLNLPSSGAVRIFACGQVHFGNQLTINNNTSGTSRLQIYSLSPANADSDPAIFVNQGSGRSLRAVLMAPQGKVSIGANSTLYGSAWGDALFLGAGATLDGSSWSGATCEAAGLDASPSCPVTITPNVPTEPAECRENALGYSDGTCLGYDLAAGVPCGDLVPVCNHGTAPFNGPLTIGYWDAQHGQMSLETPSRSPDGVCFVAALSIAPGNCVEVACAVPDGLHTLVIDPDDVLDECGAGLYDRGLDNWTVHDGRSCSGGGGGIQQVEYLYAAACPYGSSARWGFLTWNTDVPDGTSIRFSAQAAYSETELTSGGYVLVGTARSAPVDTSRCGLAGPSGSCPIKLSDVLNLGHNQGQFLALQIELEPTASTPVLRDWQVTYTCVYDE